MRGAFLTRTRHFQRLAEQKGMVVTALQDWDATLAGLVKDTPTDVGGVGGKRKREREEAGGEEKRARGGMLSGLFSIFGGREEVCMPFTRLWCGNVFDR